MPDNLTLNAPTVGGGQTVATELIGGAHLQRVKLAIGALDSDQGDVSVVNPMSVKMAGASISIFGDLLTAENHPQLQMSFVHGVNTQNSNTTALNGATVDTNASRLRLQTSTNTAGSAIFMSRKPVQYRAGQGMTVRYTYIFTTGVANSTQIAGFGTSVNGYFFGYNGITFGLLHRNAGVDTWYAQTAWSGDKCNGTGPSAFTIDPTKGNVYQIRYPYLGFGVIQFWIQDPVTGHWLLCNTIQYPNSTTATQLSNPSLHFYAQVLNAGNNTNLIGYCSSLGALLSGILDYNGCPRWAADATKALTAGGGETAVLSVRNATTYNGVANHFLMHLNSLSVGGQTSNTTATVRIRIGATLGGSPSFTTVNGSTADSGVTITSGNSMGSFDIAATTASAGFYVFNLSMNGAGSQIIDLDSQDLFIHPGETLTVSGQVGANCTLNMSLNWSEDS